MKMKISKIKKNLIEQINQQTKQWIKKRQEK